jgi:hypothetical protein
MTTLFMSKIHAALVVASLAVAYVSTPLIAQDQSVRIPVNIPFAFEAGLTHFAPGTYFLSDSQQYFLTVRSSSGSALAMKRQESSLSPATEGKVVFHRYGDQYFLREVWLKGQADHLVCPESKDERRLRKLQREANRAANVTPSSVEIALLQNPK